MSSLILPRRFYSQPQGLVGVRPEYGEALFTLCGHHDVNAWDMSGATKPTPSLGTLGKYVSFGQTQIAGAAGRYLYRSDPAANAYVGPLTLVFYGEILTPDTAISLANRGLVTKHQGTGSLTNARSWAMYIDYQTLGDNTKFYPRILVSSDGTSAGSKFSPVASTINNGTVNGFVGVFRPGRSLELYANGQHYATETSGVPSANYAGGAPIVIGSQYSYGDSLVDSVYTLNGYVLLAAALNTDLPAKDAQDVSANPWKIFRVSE